MKLPYVVLTSFVLALAGATSAATPDQVGTWTGSLKTKVRTPSGITSVKNAMQIEIAADDTTTVTLDGIVQTPYTQAYSASEALIVYADISVPTQTTIVYGVAHFKGTKLKGATSGVTASTVLLETLSGKFSLKKQE
jgi:hypothetical protein